MRPALLLPLLVLLSGCAERNSFPPIDSPRAPAQPAEPAPVGRADLAPCGGDRVSLLIGQPATALPATGGWSALRLLRPGQMMTMDHSASRLNVMLDASGIMVDMICG
jgi:hypothetical protein